LAGRYLWKNEIQRELIITKIGKKRKEHELNEREAQLDTREAEIEVRQAAQQEESLAVKLQRSLIMDEMQEEAGEMLKTASEWVVKARCRCEFLKKNRAATSATGATSTTSTATTAVASNQAENEAAEGSNKRPRRASDKDWNVVEISRHVVNRSEKDRVQTVSTRY
jgi:hypothetical protein